MITYNCPKCGKTFTTQIEVQSVKCPYCGEVFQTVYGQQPAQGAPNQAPYGAQRPIGVFDEGPSGKSRGVAALLVFFLGGFGAHYFYLGKAAGGIICFLLTMVTCGFWGVILLIQTFLFLTMSQEDFERKFVYSTSTFPLF